MTLFGETRVGVRINGSTVLEIFKDPGGSQYLLFSGSFVDANGAEYLRFESNEIVGCKGVWDLCLEGKVLTVRSGLGDVLARVEFDADGGAVAIRSLRMALSGSSSIDVSDRSFTVSTGTGPALTFTDGNAVKGSCDMIALARSLSGSLPVHMVGCSLDFPGSDPREAIAEFNDPRLGKFSDWTIGKRQAK